MPRKRRTFRQEFKDDAVAHVKRTANVYLIVQRNWEYPNLYYQDG